MVSGPERAQRPAAVRISGGARTETWQGPKGQVRLEWNAHGTMLVEFRTHGDAAFVPVIVRRLDALVVHSSEIVWLFETSSMPTYDPALRVDLTAWARKHRAKMSKIHITVRSKLVGMGVAVANLALGGIVETHLDVASFEETVRAAGLSLRTD